MHLKEEMPARSVAEVGAGDYVKVDGEWKRIASNSAEGLDYIPRGWTMLTEDGGSYRPGEIERYAKAEDLIC